jgi:hypothetical protein
VLPTKINGIRASRKNLNSVLCIKSMQRRLKMTGYREILIAGVALIVGCIMVFAINDNERLKVFLEFVTYVTGIAVAGNSAEWIGGRVFNGQPQSAIIKKSDGDVSD